MSSTLQTFASHLPAALRRGLTRTTAPADDRANAALAHERMLELEDPQPSPLLLNLATGFPSALLCVLAAGTLAGALAGREVGAALPASAPVQVVAAAQHLAPPTARGGATAAAGAALSGRQAQLQALEMQALLDAQPRPVPPPVGDARPH